MQRTPAQAQEVAAVVLAGGASRRFGGDVPKVHARLGDRCVLGHCLATLDASPVVDHLLLVVRAEDRADSERVVADVAPGRLRAVVTGGATRHESESAALRALKALPDVGWVMLHDAARPFVTLDLLERLVDRARDGRVGVVPGLPVRDAMVDQRGAIVDIAHLVTVQTPQLFARADVVEAYRRAGEDDFHGVDTAETVARYTATPVEFVASDPRNLKITTVDDLTTARALVDRWRDGAWEDRP